MMEEVKPSTSQGFVMTALNSRLQLALISRKKKQNILQQGFTLVELMIVIVIVGILSAVALPNFLNQTKKAAATEANQQASNIFKQAHSYTLENGYIGTSAAPTTVQACTVYAGTLTSTTQGAKFTYACSGTQAAFVVTATGITTNQNTNGVTVTLTGDAGQGTVASIATTGL